MTRECRDEKQSNFTILLGTCWSCVVQILELENGDVVTVEVTEFGSRHGLCTEGLDFKALEGPYHCTVSPDLEVRCEAKVLEAINLDEQGLSDELAEHGPFARILWDMRPLVQDANKVGTLLVQLPFHMQSVLEFYPLYAQTHAVGVEVMLTSHDRWSACHEVSLVRGWPPDKDLQQAFNNELVHCLNDFPIIYLDWSHPIESAGHHHDWIPGHLSWFGNVRVWGMECTCPKARCLNHARSAIGIAAMLSALLLCPAVADRLATDLAFSPRHFEGKVRPHPETSKHSHRQAQRITSHKVVSPVLDICNPMKHHFCSRKAMPSSYHNILLLSIHICFI